MLKSLEKESYIDKFKKRFVKFLLFWKNKEEFGPDGMPIEFEIEENNRSPSIFETRMNYSLFLFSSSNPLRRALKTIVKS